MDTGENIRVFVRVKPIHPTDTDQDPPWVISQDSTSISLGDTREPYVLDRVFDQNVLTKDVYESTTRELIHGVLGGVHSTVFAYGQTSSGKTHTMRGTGSDPGIIPLAVSELFDVIHGSIGEVECVVRVSYMEIYNEEIRDLLAEDDDQQNRRKIVIKQGVDGDAIVSGLCERLVENTEEVMALVDVGDAKRHVGETRMNARSSRSHAIFRMMVACTSQDGIRKRACLNLVDLAGSERIAKTGAEGQRKKEGAAINKSLLTLGTVVSKLSEGASHIPYRDSKLTRILQSSLGGNAKTAIICTITPAVEHVEETHCSLNFACRAKTVMNRVSVNEVLNDAALVKRQAKEIEDLKRRLEKAGDESTFDGSGIDEEALGRKIASITNLLLLQDSSTRKQHNNQARNHGIINKLEKRRRKTWCPNDAVLAQQHRLEKRQALDQDNDDHHIRSKQRRVSDGHAVLRDELKRLASMQGQVAEVHMTATRNDDLKKKVASLEHANSLMQEQIDAMSNALVQSKCHVSATDKQKSAVSGRNLGGGGGGPAVKEMEWRNRQLEKELGQYKARLEEAVETVDETNARHARLLEEKQAALEDAQKSAQEARARAEELEATLGRHGSESTKHMYGNDIELESLKSKCERLEAARDHALKELALKADEMEALQAMVDKEISEAKPDQDLLDEISRLKAHVEDLEKRKRAPLYQKKQEEELKAANLRALAAEKQVEDLKYQLGETKENLVISQKRLDTIEQQYEEQMANVKDEASVLARKLKEAIGSRSSDALQEKQTDASNKMIHLENELAKMSSVCSALEEQLSEVKAQKIDLEAQCEEVQACADAASAHVRFLEEKADQENQDRQKVLEDLEAEHKMCIRNLEMSAREQEELYERSKLEIDALRSEIRDLKQTKASLEERVALAAVSLNAADELRDFKRKHKEEVSKLNAQLRSITVGSKGNERAAERAAKDTNRLKSQIEELEIKLKKVVSEKSTLQSEKASLDREFRTAKSVLEKLNKNANKVATIEERKRQPLVKELDDTKARLASVEEELERCKASMEDAGQRILEVQEELIDERSKNQGLSETIDEYQKRFEDTNVQLDDLAYRYEAIQQELDRSSDKLLATETALKEANKTISEQNEIVGGLESRIKVSDNKIKELDAFIANLQEEKNGLEDSIAQAETKLELMDALQLDLDSERAHVVALQKNFEVLEKGLGDHQKELASSKEANDALVKQVASLNKTIEEKESYVSSLENQINELTAKAMEMEATLESSQSEVHKTKSLLSQAENAIEDHENTITEIHREKVAIQKLLDSSREELETLQSQVESMKHQAAEYTAVIQRLENNAREDQESINISQNTITELRAALNEERAQMMHRMQQLEKKAADAAESWQQLSQLEASMHAELDNFKSALADERSKSSLLEKEAQHRQQEIDTLKRELGACKQALEHARSQASLEDTHVQELQATIQQLKASNVALEGSKATVSKEKAKVEAELKSAQMTIEEMAELAQNSVAAHKEEVQALKSRLERIQSPLVTIDTSGMEALEERCQALESELRKSKRREEKLQALQYRLQQDIKSSGGCLKTFKNLKDVRALEYELDRTVNRAEKEIALLKAALRAAQQSPGKGGNYSHLVVEDKENILM